MTGPTLLDVDGVDQLYGLDPDEFVSARDRLVKQLKAAGDRDGAAAVKKLRRPTVVAWALNQVARGHRERVEELMDAGAAVQEAQAAAMGGGDPKELRDAAHRRRQIVSELARAAAELAGPAHHDEAVATLDAASLDGDVGELLRHGRLTKEVPAPSGFGLGGMPEPPDVPSPPEHKRADLKRLRGDVERVEQAVGAAEDNLERAHQRLAQATADAEAAERELEAARSERDRAKAALAEAESG